MLCRSYLHAWREALLLYNYMQTWFNVTLNDL